MEMVVVNWGGWEVRHWEVDASLCLSMFGGPRVCVGSVKVEGVRRVALQQKGGQESRIQIDHSSWSDYGSRHNPSTISDLGAQECN